MRTSAIVVSISAVALFAGVSGCKKKTTTETAAPETATASEPEKGLPEPEVRNLALKRVHFDFDQYSLTTEGKRLVGENAKILAEKAGLKVRIEGHADERGSTQYNIALSERRANAVRQYLIDLGVSGTHLTTVAMGEEKPLDQGTDEEAHSRNRRAELVVVEGEGVASSR